MPIIQLHYTAPVYVEVNTDTREIVRVVVDDENINLDPANRADAWDVTTSGSENLYATPEQITLAVGIADGGDAEYPLWEFGY